MPCVPPSRSGTKASVLTAAPSAAGAGRPVRRVLGERVTWRADDRARARVASRRASRPVRPPRLRPRMPAATFGRRARSTRRRTAPAAGRRRSSRSARARSAARGRGAPVLLGADTYQTTSVATAAAVSAAAVAVAQRGGARRRWLRPEGQARDGEHEHVVRVPGAPARRRAARRSARARDHPRERRARPARSGHAPRRRRATPATPATSSATFHPRPARLPPPRSSRSSTGAPSGASRRLEQTAATSGSATASLRRPRRAGVGRRARLGRSRDRVGEHDRAQPGGAGAAPLPRAHRQSSGRSSRARAPA